MKKNLSVLIMFFSLSFLSAQSVTLDSVIEGFSEYKISSGDFIQTKTLEKNGRTLKSSGTYIFCPDGIVWKTLKPVKTTLVLGKDYMIQINSKGIKNIKEAKDNPVFSGMSGSLMSLFSGDVSSLEKNFTIEFNSSADGTWKVTLVPKDRTIASMINSIELCGISSGTLTDISLVEIKESGGGKVSYQFAGQTHPEDLLPDEKELFLKR